MSETGRASVSPPLLWSDRFLRCHGNTQHVPLVNPRVGSQVALPLEVFPAGETGEGLLSGVRAHVDVQVAPLAEALAADDAGEGFLPGVDPHVDDEAEVFAEAAAAADAGERVPAGVQPQVFGQASLLAERLAAHPTGKQTLPRLLLRPLPVLLPHFITAQFVVAARLRKFILSSRARFWDWVQAAVVSILLSWTHHEGMGLLLEMELLFIPTRKLIIRLLFDLHSLWVPVHSFWFWFWRSRKHFLVGEQRRHQNLLLPAEKTLLDVWREPEEIMRGVQNRWTQRAVLVVQEEPGLHPVSVHNLNVSMVTDR